MGSRISSTSSVRRKPDVPSASFDAADMRPSPAAKGNNTMRNLKPVADWGDKTTPFRLQGCNPSQYKPDNPVHGHIRRISGDHEGFFGWLLILDAVLYGLLGTSDLLGCDGPELRGEYEARLHPEVAGTKLAEERA